MREVNIIETLLNVRKEIQNIAKNQNIEAPETYRQIAIVLDDVDNLTEAYDRLDDMIKGEKKNE